MTGTLVTLNGLGPSRQLPRGPPPQKKAVVAVGSTTVAGVIGPANSIEEVTWFTGSSGCESGARVPVSPSKPPGTTWAGPPKISPLVGVTITATPKIPRPVVL